MDYSALVDINNMPDTATPLELWRHTFRSKGAESKLCAALVACAALDRCEIISASVVDNKARLIMTITPLLPKTATSKLALMTIPLRCIALLLPLYDHKQGRVYSLFREWASWDVLQMALSFRLVVEGVLDILKDSHFRCEPMQLVADLIAQDAATIAYSVAGLFHRAIRVQDHVNQSRPPQAIFDCLQDLLEHSVSLSQRARNRIVHASIRLIGLYDIQTTQLTLAYRLIPSGEYPVASGGYGDVYKGTVCGRHVAVKALRMYRGGDSKGAKEFAKEALIWRQLNHPNVLPFYGLYDMPNGAQRIPCLVSPWMDQGNVVQYLKANPTLANRDSLACDVANGLTYLHTAKIVHGDLKGANILVLGDGRACIADFGLSSITDIATLSSTSKSGPKGTLRWLAPEILTGESTTHNLPSDIYAFACVLYEIFAGHIPFVEEKFDARIVLKVYSGQRPSRPPASSLSDTVWQLITECWTHDPRMRPSAHRALARLRQGLSARPKVEPWDTFITERLRVPPEGPYCLSASDIELRLRATVVKMDITRSSVEDWKERKAREAAALKVQAFEEHMCLYETTELPVWEEEE